MAVIHAIDRARTLNPTESYFREINETPLLTAGDEKRLGRLVLGGDVEAREHMIRANLRLVVRIARGYTAKGMSLEDMIAEGNLGLMRAVQTYDPSMNTRFSTYAAYWIKQSIKRAMINTGKTIRIPAYMVELLSKWRQSARMLQNLLNRTPSQEEVAKDLGLSAKKLNIVKKAIRIYNWIPQSDPAETGCSVEELATENTKMPGDELGEHEEMTQVLKLIETMDERDATILRMRFGLGNEEPKTLQETGQYLGLTRERVRQLEILALSRLYEGLSVA